MSEVGAVARRSYPMPPCPRPGVAAGRRHPTSEIRGGREKPPHTRGRPRAVTLRSHPEPEARGGSWEEPPTPEARASGRRSNPRSGG